MASSTLSVGRPILALLLLLQLTVAVAAAGSDIIKEGTVYIIHQRPVEGDFDSYPTPLEAGFEFEDAGQEQKKIDDGMERRRPVIKFVPSLDPVGGSAFATFEDRVLSTGWGRLHIKANPHKNDYEQAFAAGYLEGALTHKRIFQHFTNIEHVNFGGNARSPPAELLKWLSDQHKWWVGMIEKHFNDESPAVRTYWRHMSLVNHQYMGLVKGYQTHCDKKKGNMTAGELWMLNSDGDLETLISMFKKRHERQQVKEMKSKLGAQAKPESGPKDKLFAPVEHESLRPSSRRRALSEENSEGTSHADTYDRWDRPEHIHGPLKTDCTALIKLAEYRRADDDKKMSPRRRFSDLFFAHTTWRAFASMLRIYKHYDFAFTSVKVASQRISFSSSPGFISSKDDFYMTSGGLAVAETTNNVFDDDLVDKYVLPNTALCWQRTIVANRLADSGHLWTHLFGLHNSGTYNNQWMVVDYKVFEQYKKASKFIKNQTRAEAILERGLLWIIEQIPGTTKSRDMSKYMVQNLNGYWPSFNIPFFTEIWEKSGYPSKEREGGDEFSYEKCARFKILQDQQKSVYRVEDMKRVMQYNDWKHDPLSKGQADNAISSRYDLRTKNPSAFGGADSKITSSRKIKLLQANAICGPTHQQQRRFMWSEWERQLKEFGTKDEEMPIHNGHPDKWEFEYQKMVPLL
eukprot:Nk52_evm76s212 gene=Nk52_evmTU76s212